MKHLVFLRKALIMLALFCVPVFAANAAVPERVAAISPTVIAKDLFSSGVDCRDKKNAESAACTDDTSTDPLSGDGGLLSNMGNIIAFVAGAAAIIILIVGGIRYVLSNGDANKVSAAKNTVLYAIIGLLVIVLGRSIIAFVVNKL